MLEGEQKRETRKGKQLIKGKLSIQINSSITESYWDLILLWEPGWYTCLRMIWPKEQKNQELGYLSANVGGP